VCKETTDGSGCELFDDGLAAHFAAITWVVVKPVTDFDTVQAIVHKLIFGTDRIKSQDNASEKN
jgi:predicted HAD superfamily phosphohydrolase YqeG